MTNAITSYTSALQAQYNMGFGTKKESTETKSSSLASYIPEGLEKALEQALSEISAKKEGANVKLDDITKYREELELLFTEKVEKELKALGLSNMDFSISLDPKNSDSSAITVSASSKEDKALIEKYFNNNPGVVEEFRKIQALTNLEKAMGKGNTAAQIAPEGLSTIRANYQAQALDIFLGTDSEDEAWDFTSLIANFNSTKTSFMSGINTSA